MASKVVFQADTSKFTAPVERSATVVRDLSKALKEQEQAARQTYRDQIANAKAAGASVEQLQEIEQNRYRSLLALQAAQKQISAENVSNGKAAVDGALAQKEAVDLVTRAYEQQLAAVTATFGAIQKQHAEVAGSIAGGAAIRTLDGGQNVRAVENFLAKTLGLGDTLQKLFPLVGGIAFIQILTEAGEKLYELHKQAEETTKALNIATEDLHAKTQVTIDDLAVQADKLQLNIDKLKGHPGNGLQLGLDEARKSADELLASLTADRKEMETLFKQTHVGAFAGWLGGANPTSQQEKSLGIRREGFDRDISAINTDVNGRYANSSSDAERKALDAERRRRIEARFQQELASTGSERRDLVNGNSTIDVDPRTGQVRTRNTGANNARIGQLDFYSEQVRSQLSLYQYRNKVSDLAGQEQGLKGGADSSHIYNEAVKKASEEQRKQWETQLKEQQRNGDMTIAQEREFWLARLQVVDDGSDNYRLAYGKFLDATKKQSEEQRKQLDELRKANEELRKTSLSQLLAGLNPGAIAQSRGIMDAQTSGLALSDAQRSARYSTAEAGINAEQQAGRLSKLDAAIQLQTLHTKLYNEQLAQLKTNLTAVPEGPDAESQRNRINQQITGLNAGREQQVIKDNAAANPKWSSATVGFRDAINDFTKSSLDAAEQMKSLTQNILGGLNRSLSSLITGGGGDFAGLFRGIGQQVANAGLGNIESSLFGSLKKSGGSGVGGFFATLFGGARATGGPVTAGQAYLVGEKGPEPFIPSTSGTVLPTSSLLGGGGDTINFHPGSITSSDPAAIEKAVRKAVAGARAGIIADSVAASNDRSKRLPSNARR